MLNVYVNYCCGGSFCVSTWSPNFAHGDNKVYCIVLYNWQDVLSCTPSSKYHNLSHIRLKHQHFEGGHDFSTESFCSERQLTGLFLSVFSCCVSNVPQNRAVGLSNGKQLCAGVQLILSSRGSQHLGKE